MSSLIRPEDDVTPVPENHLREVLKVFGVLDAVAVVGIRGYVKQFRESVSGGNIIGKYDDVLCVVTPKACTTFLGNTDPTRLIKDPKTGLGRAVLEAGNKFLYTRGIHGITGPKERRRPAWVQAGPVIIRRYDDKTNELGPVLTGQWIGCNIHDGGWSTTGSAACQTVAPERWKVFDSMLDKALQAAAQSKFWYVLTT